MYIASADISLYHLGSTVFRAELTFPGATGRDTASAWQASKSFQVISAPSSRHDWVKISRVSGKTSIGIHVGKTFQ